MIQWGIIGCGNVTEVKSGPAFNKVPDSKLVAVMRRNAEKAKDYAERHQVPKWYGNAQQLIDDPDVNVIYIATPPLYHEEFAIKSIEAGKPVYIEKPMTMNAAEAERIAAFAREKNVKVSIAHYRREQPLFLKIKSLIDENYIGRIRLVNLQFFQPYLSNIIAKTEENWRLNPSISGGGLFHDLAPHQLDIMVYFFGKWKETNGISFNSGKFYDADDTISGQIIFENDVLFNGTWCFTVPEKRDACEIIGEEGKISFKVFEHRLLKVIKKGEKELFQFEPLQHVQQPMIEKVVQYFLGKSSNPCSGEEGVEVMKLIDAFTKK